MSRAAWSALVAGALPILAVNLAYWINVQHGLEGCFPYLDGCHSVSRGVREGPGLWWFKAAALPTVIAMVLTWRWMPGHLAGAWARRLGVVGAAALLLYAATLGTDGELYKWMRRYGVVFYFGLTGIAQLMVANRLWRERRSVNSADGGFLSRFAYLALAFLTWGVGLLSAFKRRLFDDPALVDRVENAAEWGFALGLSLLFVALSAVLKGRKGLPSD